MGPVESLQPILLAAFRFGRGSDRHLHHGLARLDRRVVAVLQHHDAVHHAFREAPPDILLDEIGGSPIQTVHRNSFLRFSRNQSNSRISRSKR